MVIGNNPGTTELRLIEILKSFDPRGSKVVQSVHKGLKSFRGDKNVFNAINRVSCALSTNTISKTCFHVNKEACS